MKAKTSAVEIFSGLKYLSPPILGVLFCLFLISLFSTAAAKDNSIYLKNLVLDNQAGKIMLRFGLELQGEAKAKEALENGLSLRLECETELYMHKSLWYDHKLAEKVYSNKIYYDSLSKEFILEQTGKKNNLKNKNLPLLLREGWKNIVMCLGPWSSLERGKRYKLKLNVHVNQANIPKWLKKTFFFWSWSITPPETYQLDFVY